MTKRFRPSPVDEARRRQPLRPLRDLLPLVARHRGRAAGAALALAASALATLAIPQAVRRMIDYGFRPDQAGLIDQYFLMLLAVVGLLATASATRFYLVTTLGERIVAELRSAVFARLTTLSAGYFDRVRSGELVSTLTADTTLVRTAVSFSSSVALRNMALFAGAAALMAGTAPRLAAIVLLAIPLVVLPLILFGRRVRRASRAAQERLAEASGYAAEQVAAVRVLQAFGQEAQARRTFDRAIEASCRAAGRSTAARAVLTGGAIFLVFASVVAVLWLGAQDVLTGRMSAGTLSQFVLYAVLAASALAELSQVWTELAQAAGAAERIAEILRERPAIAAPAEPAGLPEPPQGALAFEAVRFAYPGRPDLPVLDGLSFRVRPGERVALVGPSGAGKSTVFALLGRAYDVDGGRVLVDGLDVRAVDPGALRARFAPVPQDPTVFADTVAANIRYGRPDADDAAVAAAAASARAAGFVAALPDGYATPVGERGVTLSGGQRQRLAIARALLRDAPVLLLDEATAALDAESERAVQEALDVLMEGRTTLVIAHRLATVLKADRILVMDAGRIVEEGTHAALVAQNGLYARLAGLQFGAAA